MHSKRRTNMRFVIRVFLTSVVVMFCVFVVFERLVHGPGLPANPYIPDLQRAPAHGLHQSPGLTSYTTCKEEKSHFAFLKVPKTGSSTVQNIFYRFGTIRGLTFILPRYNNYIGRGQQIDDAAIIPPPSNKQYDILCNHVRYKRSEFARVLPKDTIYVGIVREPLPHLESYIYYYHFMNIEGDDKLSKYLEDPDKYRDNGLMSNPQTHYYGLQNTKDMPNVKRFIKNTLSEFDVIIVLERFDESLLVMKRKFCWDLADILYIRKNTNFGNPRKASSHPQRTKHKALALSEYLFYDNCQMKLIKAIMSGGEDFQRELDFYRETLRGVYSFCLDKRRNRNDLFYIGASKWGPETNVSAAACYLMMLPELQFLDTVGKKQYGHEWGQLHINVALNHGRNIEETKRNATLVNGQRVEKRSFNFKDRFKVRNPFSQWN